MDPKTGNIYTSEQAKLLGFDFDDLIPLHEDEVDQLFKVRVAEAAKIKQRKKNKAARAARKRNR